MTAKKLLHINFFEMSCTGAHMGIGQWKNEGDNQSTKDTLGEFRQYVSIDGNLI